MLDYRLLRSEPDTVRDALLKRGYPTDILDEWLALDQRWRKATTQVETLTAEQNRISKEIPLRKKAGEDPEPLLEQLRTLKAQIEALEDARRTLEAEREAKLLLLPNIPHSTTPVGNDASENVEVRRGGQPHPMAFEPKPHWELAESLGLIDFERGAKVGGSGFHFYTGLGARLERALINFMLDLHTREHGYVEVFPPFLVRPEVMVGTGQLPKFEEEMYRCADDPLYLIPTAEVPLTNYYREEVLQPEQLPIKLCGYSPCFRREAGSYGKDVRGLNRLHQFDKVEIVQIVAPEHSYKTLEEMRAYVEKLIESLELSWRVVLLCGGDMSFASAKTYDVEVWSPAQERWLEVSSISNFETFQSVRMKLRYRQGKSTAYVHTLNGSALALPRIVASLLETHQTEDGRIRIPKVLQPYYGAEWL